MQRFIYERRRVQLLTRGGVTRGGGGVYLRKAERINQRHDNYDVHDQNAKLNELSELYQVKFFL